VFYRRLADSSITTEKLLADLAGRLRFKNPPFYWYLNRLCFRFRQALIATLNPRCEALDRQKIELWVPEDPDSPEIPRQ
jgi:hypothetical protein